MNHKNILNEIVDYKMIVPIMRIISALSQIFLIIKGKLLIPEIKAFKRRLIKNY